MFEKTNENYTIGRGKLLFGKFDKNGEFTEKAERYLGNTPSFSLSTDTETKDHFNADSGMKEKDLSIILSVARKATFECDDITMANLAMTYFAETTKITQAGGEATETIEKAIVGGTYKLGVTRENPVGIRALDQSAGKAVVVKSGTNELIVNRDYYVDYDTGSVTIAHDGTVKDDDPLSITYSTAPVNYERIATSDKPVEGQLRFNATNPVGIQCVYFFPRVIIRPNGDVALKGDEWQTLPFTVEIMKKGNLSAIYLDGKPFGS